MRFRDSRRAREVTLDLTPLIDIVFLLLIFFLVTTTFTRKETEIPDMIPVNLPTGVSGTKADQGEWITLTVTAEGQVRINDGELLQADEVIIKLKEIQKNDPEAIVMLRGDQGATHGEIVKVLDVIKGSGFQKVNMVVKKE